MESFFLRRKIYSIRCSLKGTQESSLGKNLDNIPYHLPNLFYTNTHTHTHAHTHTHTHTHTHKHTHTNTHTSYPGSCVYKSKPIHFPSRDTDRVASAFIADLHARLPSVCGDQVRYSSQALTPFANLQPLTAQKHLHANLRRLSPPKQTHTPIKDIPPHLRFVPKVEPKQVVPTISISQQFKGIRVVPIFKPKSIASSAQQKVLPHQSHPSIPKFKSSSISTNSHLLGKRQLNDSLTKRVAKRPCLETTSLVPNIEQLQSTTNLIQPLSQFNTKAQTAQPSIKKLSIAKRTQSKLLPPQVQQSLPFSSLASTQQKPSTYQTVPDMNQSLTTSSQLDGEDFADFLPHKALVPVKKATSLSKGILTPKPTNTSNTGAMFTGVSTDLVNKVKNIFLYFLYNRHVVGVL